MSFWDAASELNPTTLACLFVALLIAFGFEFINGFHDTANAVTTVIYTRTLKPTPAVIYSGVMNFLGVLFGVAVIGFVLSLIVDHPAQSQVGVAFGIGTATLGSEQLISFSRSAPICIGRRAASASCLKLFRRRTCANSFGTDTEHGEAVSRRSCNPRWPGVRPLWQTRSYCSAC